MTRRIFAMLVIGLFVGMFSGSALAEVGYSGDMVPFGADKSIEADAWPAAEPVETGALPGVSKEEHSLIDTHFNPFYPERRMIDQDGGGE